jgi:ParB-like chromosome segregation protein Spo0J
MRKTRQTLIGKEGKSPSPPAIGNPTAGHLPMRRVSIEAIKVAKYNPRKDLQPCDPEYQKLRRSIETFGYVDPLIWNARTGNLVGGHQRLKILTRDFGVGEIDVAVVNLPPAQEKALNIALNKIAGEWEDAALSKVLAELQLDDSIDATVTGLDPDELQAMITELAAPPIGLETHPRTERSFRVVADCRNAAEQRRVLAMLEQKKIACHALTRA